MGLCDLLGICNDVQNGGGTFGEPHPSKSQSYPYADVPFASSQTQSIVVDAPSKV